MILKILQTHAWSFLGFYLLFPSPLLFGELNTDNEFWGWIYVGFICLCWREVSVDLSSAASIQGFLHKALGEYKRHMQWHAILKYIMVWEVIVALIFVYRDVFDIHDILARLLQAILAPRATKRWAHGWSVHGSQGSFEFHVPSHSFMPTWLLVLVLLAPLACVATFVVVWTHHKRLSQLANDYLSRFENETQVSTNLSRFQALDKVIICVMLPSWFSLMSLYSLAWIWRGLTHSDASRQLECLVTFHMDDSLAVILEIFTVLAFGLLVMRPIQRSAVVNRLPHIKLLCWNKPERYWLTMNGVFYCVLVGVLHNIVQIVASVCLLLISKDVGAITTKNMSKLCEHGWKQWLYCHISEHNLAIQLLETMGLVFCTYNMYFACNLAEVAAYLPHANLKFHGTRAVIIIAQIQAKVLVVQPSLPEKYDELHWLIPLNGWYCALLHMALMQFEVFFIALWHMRMWRGHLARRKQEKKLGRATPMPERHDSGGTSTALLRHCSTWDGVDDDDEHEMGLIRRRSSHTMGFISRLWSRATGFSEDEDEEDESVIGDEDTHPSDQESPLGVQLFIPPRQAIRQAYSHKPDTQDITPGSQSSVKEASVKFHDNVEEQFLRDAENGNSTKPAHRKRKRRSKLRRKWRQPAHGDYPWRLSLCLLAIMLILLVWRT